jgi:hypothetical protein
VLQKETVTRNIFYKHKDFTNKVFHNIGVENNGIINNADGTSSCGTAFITGIISGNPPGNSCP